MNVARWSGREFLFAGALVALVVITRIPFLLGHLYEWDSINYALGMERYDVPLLQPHSPGYPLYTLAARAVNAIVHDPNTSMVTLSVAFSCLAILSVYALGMDMGGRAAAAAAAAALFFAPAFWFYGEVSTTYAAEGMWSLFIAFSCYRTTRGGRGWLFASAALLGAAGGFRGNIVLFLFPLWLYCASKSCGSVRAVVAALAVMGACVLSWLLPLLVMFGAGYLDASRMLCRYSGLTSFFVGSTGAWSANARKALLYSLYGFGPGSSILLLCLVAAFKRGRGGEIPRAFFLWWILPAFLYYFLFHIKKPGYTLTYVPALALLLGALLSTPRGRRVSRARILALAAAFAWDILVLFPPAWPGRGMAVATGRGRLSLLHLDDTADAMRAVRALSATAGRRTAILSASGAYTRFASYYLPQCYVYHIDYHCLHPLSIYRGRKMTGTGEDGVMRLAPGIEELVFIGPPGSLAFEGDVQEGVEVCREPRVTVFRLTPAFRGVSLKHTVEGEGVKEVRVLAGERP